MCVSCIDAFTYSVGHWEQIEAAGDFLEAPKDRTIARGRINTSSFIKSKLVSDNTVLVYYTCTVALHSCMALATCQSCQQRTQHLIIYKENNCTCSNSSSHACV